MLKGGLQLTKECEVVLQNEKVLVVDFNGIMVQLPCIEDKKPKVLVKYENGKYTIVTKRDKISKGTNGTKNAKEKAKETELVNDIATESDIDS